MNALECSSRIADLAHREHAALADLLLAVAEFDAQEGYRQLGFASLFDFLHREIGLSRGSAYYRQVGARLVRRFPEIEGPIRDGRLCITTVSELAKVMNEENRAEVLPRFFGCSRREAKQLVAELRPVEQAPRRTVVTAVPSPAGSALVVVQPGSGPDTSVMVGPETWVTVSAHALDRDRPDERTAPIRAGSAEASVDVQQFVLHLRGGAEDGLQVAASV